MNNIEFAKECGATVQHNEIFENNDPDAQVIGNYPSFNFSDEALEEYTTRILADRDEEYQAQRVVAADNKNWFDALDCDYREKCKQLDEANALIAMQAEAILDIADNYGPCGFNEGSKQDITLTATAATVAEWRAKETEPLQNRINEQSVVIIQLRHDLDCANMREESLRSEVAMLLKTAMHWYAARHDEEKCEYTEKALSDTKATAESYEREVRAKALEEAFKVAFECDYGVDAAYAIRAMKH